MLQIDLEMLNKLSEKAKLNPRRRLHQNFHKSYQEPMQRLINACEPDSYFRPHCHSDSGTTEVLVILKGRVVVVEFDDTGKIIQHVILGAKDNCFAVEISSESWHSMIALEEGSVVFEFKEGPFDENRMKVFALWSAGEGSDEAKRFNQKIINELKII